MGGVLPLVADFPAAPKQRRTPRLIVSFYLTLALLPAAGFCGCNSLVCRHSSPRPQLLLWPLCGHVFTAPRRLSPPSRPAAVEPKNKRV